jgi:hypothetical protein
MRPGAPLAGFAAAAETTNVAGHAAMPGSRARRPGLDPEWLAGRTSCPQQRRRDASGDSTPGRHAGHGDQVTARLAWSCMAGFYPDLTKSGAMATLYSGLRVTGVCQAAG